MSDISHVCCRTGILPVLDRGGEVRGTAVKKSGLRSNLPLQECDRGDRPTGIWENHHLWILTKYDISSSNTDSTVNKKSQHSIGV